MYPMNCSWARSHNNNLLTTPEMPYSSDLIRTLRSRRFAFVPKPQFAASQNRLGNTPMARNTVTVPLLEG